jgi:glycosyltransferase involved in cell wall biosynthesis
MPERVTIGVPVYRGEPYLAETLRSIQEQTHRELEVLLSIDGPDPACEAIGRTFLTDSRFRLVVQPKRLGWVGNLNWLLARVETDFWYFHQQDDLVAPDYVETLLAHARVNPAAALIYCDLIPFGRVEASFSQPASVRGETAFMRLMTLLHEHFPAFAFRGLTRAAAVREAGGVPVNDADDFGVDMSWLAGVARAGELLHVARPLYRKRYHSENTESKWWAWPKEKRLSAWCAHCVNMLEQVLRIEASTQERRLLWAAAVERLTSPQAAGHFLPVAQLTRSDREWIFDNFLDRARASALLDIPTLLDAEWREIQDWTRGFYWIPSGAPFEIEDFGPRRVRSGAPFNTQPDGSSAIWVRLSRQAEPGLRLRLGDAVLETVLEGALLTACVPASVTEHAGKKPLVVVGPEGNTRCQPVLLKVRKSTGHP